MEFKKIDDKKFQCLLFEEDLEENNISLDDFFRNDTEKIHGLLDVVMEEARKEIGIAPSGESRKESGKSTFFNESERK